MIRYFFLITISFLFLIPVAKASNKNPILVLTLKTGDVRIELEPEVAPINVARVIKLTESGLYDGVVFHRVLDGFMAQTGDVQYGNFLNGYDPIRVGTGGSKNPSLPAEFSSAPFVRGVVAMARSFDPNSANSQFFICYGSAPWLERQYTVIGHVISGMSFVDSLKKGDSANNGLVKEPDCIIKAFLQNSN